MNKFLKKVNFKSTALSFSIVLSTFGLSAQTNVFDDVIATSPNHTYLEAALIQQGLDVLLQNPSTSVTVFAPDDDAFTSLATSLGTNVAGLLALPNLTDILSYHVLGTAVPSTAITNGAIVQPLSPTNTLKLTLTTSGSVFVNHGQVTAANLTTDNGIVHVVNRVLLPVETVVDVAIDNGFSYLTTAVITAELLPALSNPLANFTVFAPTNTAFDNLATALGTNIAGLLSLPNLADVLTYHVLGTEVLSTAVTNGAIVQPISPSNTLKLTLTSTGSVYVNQAKVTAADVQADNGVVHVLDAVVLPIETVVDLAIDNGFTSLAAAVVTAELLPALTNPLTNLTVFAPTNAAFDNLATALGTNLAGVLAHPELESILLYHVVGGEVLSTSLTNGPVATVNGQSVLINLPASGGVTVNNANVTLADVLAGNGVVHVIDAVLVPSLANLTESTNVDFNVYPNPTVDEIQISSVSADYFSIINTNGSIVKKGALVNNQISVSDLEMGTYFLQLTNNTSVYKTRFVKM
jgi:uncharacterized surface protein with fasciclin (FAS1) repeats